MTDDDEAVRATHGCAALRGTAKYICLWYDDDVRSRRASEEARRAIAAEQAEWEAELRREGRIAAAPKLDGTAAAATLRVRNGSNFVDRRPANTAAAMLGALFVIHARDLNDAIRIAGECPAARIGSIEVRPLR